MKAAVYCGTRNLYGDMVTAAKSLLANTSVEKIYFIIEDKVFPYKLPDIFEIIDISNQKFFPPDGPNYINDWTYMVLIRAALTKILPQSLDKVLSLDVDTIVDKNIDELWNMSLENMYLAAVMEPYKTRGNYLYINMGVAMLNLRKLRSDHKDDEIIYSLNFQKYFANEQDCINDHCQGHIQNLPGDYNVSNFTSKYTDEPKIIHYAGIKKWQNNALVSKYQEMSLEKIMEERNARYNHSSI